MMDNIGTATIDRTGSVIAADTVFCGLLGTREADLLGRSIVELTAPAARERHVAALHDMVHTHRAFTTHTHYLDSRGGTVPLRAIVSLVRQDGCADRAIIQAWADDPSQPANKPALLLECARFLAGALAAQSSVIDPMLSPAWDIVLAIYIAEATGNSFSPAMLTDRATTGRAITDRWMRALVDHGVIEREHPPGLDLGDPYRLTATGLERMELHLANVVLSAAPLVDHLLPRA